MAKERQVSGEGEKSRRRERGEREGGMKERVWDLGGERRWGCEERGSPASRLLLQLKAAFCFSTSDRGAPPSCSS